MTITTLVEELREGHERADSFGRVPVSFCVGCRQSWPCPSIRAAEELERVSEESEDRFQKLTQARRDAIEDRRTVERLRGALEPFAILGREVTPAPDDAPLAVSRGTVPEGLVWPTLGDCRRAASLRSTTQEPSTGDGTDG